MLLLWTALFLAVAIVRVKSSRRAKAGGGATPGSRDFEGFLLWALVGYLITLAALTALSIGLFIAPLALVAVWVVGRYFTNASMIIGVAAGAGAMAITAGIIGKNSDASLVIWAITGSCLVVGSTLGSMLLVRSGRRSG